MMELKDWLIVGATAIGPILAVQAQKWVERLREHRGRKLRLFNTLMATRATRIHNDHVKALNMIDLVFYGPKRFRGLRRRKKDQDVLDAWKEYLDHLNTGKAEAEAVWSAKSEELFLNLLSAMAVNLGFSFDRVQLKRGAYYPKGYGDYELDNLATRKGLLDVLNGKPLKMEITNIPQPPPQAALPQNSQEVTSPPARP